MNKYLAIGSLVLGLGVFFGTLAVITVPVRLHVTEDMKVTSEYEAPIVVFRGDVPKKKGMAHKVRVQRIEVPNVTIVGGEGPEGVMFGQFSTKEAMEYRTTPKHKSRVLNPKKVMGDPRYAN